jgi:hypothetical protein
MRRPASTSPRWSARPFSFFEEGTFEEALRAYIA